MGCRMVYELSLINAVFFLKKKKKELLTLKATRESLEVLELGWRHII